MSQEPCVFYRVEDVHLDSKTITAELTPAAPLIERREWCAHPRAEHCRNTIKPNALCGGDLGKCVIPLSGYRRF